MRAAIYTRISDDPRGKAAGVERQSDECRALAEARGVDVVEELVDNDLSATSGKRRPGFDRVLELVRAGRIDTIIVWHTDRLYRLPRDLEPLIALADAHPLRFLTVTASEIDLNTASGRMVARILAAASAQEVEHKADRQRSASDQRASKGEPTVRPGYGLRRAGDHVVEIPEEAAVIREVVRRALAGESFRALASELNDRGTPSPAGKPWTGNALRKAVHRPAVAGLRVHRGQVVGEARGDVILDRDSWDRLTALLSDPSRAPMKRGRGALYLLSGLAVCGACGSRMHRHAGWTPKPDSKTRHAVSPAYQCQVCTKVRRAQAPVDELVTEVLLRRLELPDAAELFVSGDPDAAHEARVALAAVDARLAMAADQFADDLITGDQLRRITEKLRAERGRLEAVVVASMPSMIPADLPGANARQVWPALSMDVQRAVLSGLLTVTILPVGAGRGPKFNPASVEITWN